ncbi:MAG: hypothetical protein BRC41_02815, partial [Cyanobacteria bacterium QH_9_48_43]
FPHLITIGGWHGYCIASLLLPLDVLMQFGSAIPETTQSFAARMGGDWGLEKQLHYLRDLSPAEDQSRIRTTPLPPMGALARNVAMNLYRDAVFTKMAQAQVKFGLGLEQV